MGILGWCIIVVLVLFAFSILASICNSTKVDKRGPINEEKEQLEVDRLRLELKMSQDQYATQQRLEKEREERYAQMTLEERKIRDMNTSLYN